MTPEMEQLAQRVGRLERDNRRLRLVGTAVALLAAVLLFMAAGKAPRTIEAEKIVVLDSHGHARIMLGTPEFSGAAVDTRPDEPVIWLTDANGTDRAMLTMDGLRFADNRGRPLRSKR